METYPLQFEHLVFDILFETSGHTRVVGLRLTDDSEHYISWICNNKTKVILPFVSYMKAIEKTDISSLLITFPETNA